ncbi:hypothetical protein ACLOJK_035344 [Asimina triloba]
MDDFPPVHLGKGFLLLCFFLLSGVPALSQAPPILLGNDTDRLSLLAFKNSLTSDALRSWNLSLPFCQWLGVTCTTSGDRVASLNLTTLRLLGPLSPHLSNLTSLTHLDLSTNFLHGPILSHHLPPNLLHLNLSANSFTGPIPTNLSRLSRLAILDLHQNQLQGTIPHNLGLLPNLTTLALEANNLSGNIPPSLGNLSSSLSRLTLQRNRLRGSVPHELSRLTSLQYLRISFNNLVSLLPPSLFNLSSIDYFNVAANRLEGALPPDMGFTLPNVRLLILAGNRFSGAFPPSLTNASKLQSIDISDNSITGPVPLDLGRLTRLFRISMPLNRLGSGAAGDLSFLISLANVSGLTTLDFGNNGFGGELPDAIGNLSPQLNKLSLANNRISGGIPNSIENLVGLNSLLMGGNLFQGSIPVGVGKLEKMTEFQADGNRLSGQIPASLGNLSQLNVLHLSGNRLQGSIPPSLGNCRSLQKLDLSKNQLNGSVPVQVFSISALTALSLNENSLGGTLELDENRSENLQTLDVSRNRFSGEIPSMLGNCIRLQNLLMSNNLFHGAIPLSLSKLTVIQALDLSRNDLSGRIPEYFGRFGSLKYLNLSFNRLEGEVPKAGIFVNASAVLALGNNRLCGSVVDSQLPPCSDPNGKKNKGSSLSSREIVAVVGAAVGVVVCGFVFALLYRSRKSWRTRFSVSASASDESSSTKLTYADLLQATNRFSSEKLIGVGSYGSVYEGILAQDKTVVAVKVLDLKRRGAGRSFLAECEALRNIRHRNLVKILTTCSSIDFKGEEFKALVFEYMPNGNLDMWLHPRNHEELCFRNLSLLDRLSIAIDVAAALDYLHHQCETPIVHCDLKPSNILLGNDMIAHVSDFGLAKILGRNSHFKSQTSTIEIKGSIGYVPPAEYGMGGKVSTHGDVYSYGVLLLETFTGKRPTDSMFKDGLSLRQLVKNAWPDQVEQIADSRMLLGEVKDATTNDEIVLESGLGMQDCLISVFRVGLACSAESPRERISMREVVPEMQAIRDLYLRNANRNSPSTHIFSDESSYSLL